jgi:ABC-type sugar transport system permease subunit
LGFEKLQWLESPYLAMPSIILMSIWKGLGYNVIIFLAGLQNIPKTLYEAGKIDGTTKWQSFRHITWPLLSPTTFFILIMSTISSFQVFAQVFMMTQGGPMKSTTVVVYYLYEQAFQKIDLGYASAIAYGLFLIIFSMTIFQRTFFGKKVHYS